MKARAHEKVKQVKAILRDSEYITGREIAEKIGMCSSSVCRIIRTMRTQGIGVHTTKDGYVLSSHATKADDVGFLRRLNGRRTSDVIALAAAAGGIKNRWRTIEDRTSLRLIVGPLTGDVGKLQAGMKVLSSKINGKGL